jgi:hypothetical protein
MVDVKENKTATAPANTAGDGVVAAKGSFTATHTMSKGEKWFNWGVYSGMNYWLNLAMSVVITDIFKNRWGQGALKKTADVFAKGLSSTKLFTPADAFHHSKTALETFALLSGGNILLIPLKMLEDRKRPIVHWLNEKMGVNQKAEDGKELSPDKIYIKEAQPEQSWGRIIWRRVLGILAVVGVGHVINGAFRDRTKPLPLRDEPDTYGGKTRITDIVMGKPGSKFGVNNVLKKIPGGTWLAENKYAQAYMGFTVLDSVFTGITAVIMKVTNGAKKMNGETKTEEKPTVQALDTFTENNEITQPSKNRESLKAKKPAAVESYTELAQQKPSSLAMAP